MDTDNEIQKIFERYERRKYNPVVTQHSNEYIFNHYMCCERELIYLKIIKSRYKLKETLQGLKFLEVGAGTGDNLFVFKRIGFHWNQIYANELLQNRYEILERTFPSVFLLKGDACKIDVKFHNTFDIILVSTVFSSILDEETKRILADKIYNLLKIGGIIIFYDFIYNNPKNIDVRGIKKKEIKSLFPDALSISSYSCTLAPPYWQKGWRFLSFS